VAIEIDHVRDIAGASERDVALRWTAGGCVAVRSCLCKAGAAHIGKRSWAGGVAQFDGDPEESK
jgi:hypothetical protein